MKIIQGIIKIIQRILTTNNCFKAGRKMPSIKGLMVHSVGCNQPSAEVFIDLWAKNVSDVCPHGIVDAEGIYQLLPWDHYAWHACDPANSMYIGVETTEPATITYKNGSVTDNDPKASKAHIDKVYRNTVELFAYLCGLYKLDPLTQIISHNEGRLRGIASAHYDPEHLWTRYSYTMDGFRRDVKAAMAEPAPTPTPAPMPDTIYRVRRSWADAKSQIGAFNVLDNAKRACKAGYSVYDDSGKAVYTVPADAPKKTVDEIAKEVIRGDWGVDPERTKRLTAAGYDAKAVQKRVNEVLGIK